MAWSSRRRTEGDERVRLINFGVGIPPEWCGCDEAGVVVWVPPLPPPLAVWGIRLFFSGGKDKRALVQRDRGRDAAEIIRYGWKLDGADVRIRRAAETLAQKRFEV